MASEWAVAGRDVKGNVRPGAKGAMSSDGGLSVLAKTESSQYRVSSRRRIGDSSDCDEF